MLSPVRHSFVTVLLPAGLALLLCTQPAHAQRRGTLQNRQNGGRSPCQLGQSGSQLSTLSQQYGLQPQLSAYGRSYNPQSQLYNNQTTLVALQQQLTMQQLIALQQYVLENQLLGVAPDDALQAARLAIQQQNRAALRGR